MTYQQSLAEAFRTHDIKKIAIVDDAYDLPRIAALSKTKIDAFASELADAIDDGTDAIEAALSSQGVPSLQVIRDGFKQDDALLTLLWRAYGAVASDTPAHQLLRVLFADFEVQRRDKLAQLAGLETLIEEASGIRAEIFDSQARPHDLVSFQLIFLDFYLEDPEAPTRADVATGEVDARKRSIDFLKALIDAAPSSIPLVMLISSAATAEDLPKFRQQASMLASAIQFLPKQLASDDRFRAQAVLLGLIVRRREIDALWHLLALWKRKVAAASADLMTVVHELDVTDYAYLERYRLTSESIPLARYLIWLFNGYLSSLVESSLQDASTVKLIGDLSSQDAVAGRIAPTEAITTMYSAVTTSQVGTAIEGFAPIAWPGDIFVSRARWAEIFGQESPGPSGFTCEMPEVLGVVTPACDLVPNRPEGSKAKVRTVMTIGGKLTPLRDVTSPTPYFLMLNKQPVQIEWDPKWPVTIPIAELDGTTAFGGRYRWVGRLRDPYVAELRQSLTEDVGRVALNVVPTMPQRLAVRVLVRSADGSYRTAFERRTDQKGAWAFFSSVKGGRTCHLRDDLVWDLRDWVRGAHAGQPDKHSLKLMAAIDKEEFVQTLQHPFDMKGADQIELSQTSIRIKKVASLAEEAGADCQLLFLVAVCNEDAAIPVVLGEEAAGTHA